MEYTSVPKVLAQLKDRFLEMDEGCECKLDEIRERGDME
jgi:fructose 1,6-bisphosphate aldolase/phosphatase